MPRKSRKTAVSQEVVSQATTVEPSSGPTPEADQPPSANDAPAGEWTSKLPDPHNRDTVNVGNGETLRLARGTRFLQNRISFAGPEGSEPSLDSKYAAWLEERGWKYRPEENVWTKQLQRPAEDERYARSKSDVAMEREFVELANLIRADRSMPPVMGIPEKQVAR